MYHTYDSRRSAPGFPDVVAIRGRWLLAVELKSATGKPSDEQLVWLRAFGRVEAVDAFVLRPAPSLDELEAYLSLREA